MIYEELETAYLAVSDLVQKQAMQVRGHKRTYTELEAAHIALCKRVEADLVRIVGMCGNGRADAAGNATARLLEQVENTRLQYQMCQEQAAPEAYDLAALSVNASVPSNSGTEWEKED